MTIGAKENLSSALGRISTPAKEMRDMLAIIVDMLMSNSGNPVGTAYFVDGIDGSGSNTNNGLQLSSPKLTIKAALALCTSGQNDTIFVMNYWQPTGEDWPIVVNKEQVHIKGLALPNLPYPVIHPDDDSPAFAINKEGSYGSIERLTIGGGNSYAGITLGRATGGSKPEGVSIKECLFGHTWFGTPLSGIDSPEFGAIGLRIEKCTFMGNLVSVGGKITGNAIDLTTTSAFHEDLQIVDNIFKGVVIGVDLVQGGPGTVITGNKFVVADSADGEAITLAATTDGSLIDDNRAMKGAVAMSNNPFRDLGTNHWGLNYRQGLSVMPATT